MAYGFTQQLRIGELGVRTVITVLRDKGFVVEDLQDDKRWQKRGVDLFVEGLGYLEVKTDSHSPERFFFELDCGNRPGGVDRSCSDYFCVYFFRYRTLYLLLRSDLQQWLRNNYGRIQSEHPDWIKTIHSQEGSSTWSAVGVVVPREEIMAAMKVSVIEWEENDEHVYTNTEGNEGTEREKTI